jgi:uncharacterized surface protein with fasciclin (FAS1) repeats
MTAADLMKKVDEGKGKAMLTTVEGEMLTIDSPMAGKLEVTDAKGDKAMITIPDVLQSNGVIQVIDTVLIPG